ncbi:lantibiotic dehydratase [Micromonospora sp. NPDC005172]|uniref:lantibiotic dehydratase n=1 Tax=Micromonospora sp. NPDC005172 TaxID=3156867 RepID=UPI0033B39C90
MAQVDARDLLVDPAAAPIVEAVTLASRSMAETFAKVGGGRDLGQRRTDRAGESLTRYLLRMAGRATPFGLMAGVALGSFGDAVSASVGRDHRRHVRPDHGWLAALVGDLERDPVIVERCVVVVDDLVRVEGDLVVQPFGAGRSGVVRRTLRRTRLVAAILKHAACPVLASTMVDCLVVEFPGAPRDRVLALVTDMVGAGVLLTPLGRTRSLDMLEAALPGHKTVESARQAITAYSDAPAAGRPAALAETRCLAGEDEAIQVDLGLDLDVTLPRSVAVEAERAASALHRLAIPDTPRSRAMQDYHARFLDRYGLGRAVPLTEVIDPDLGIGLPDGHKDDPRLRRLDFDDVARTTVLTRLLVESTLHGGRDVVLDDDTIDQLHRPGGSTPASIDLFCALVSRDAAALQAGDFELIISPLTGTQQAGASLGRFGHLSGLGIALTELVRPVGDPDATLPVELVHSVIPPRYGNVLPSSRTLPTALVVGVAPMSDNDLRLNDVAIVADAERLRLYSLSRGRELDVIIPHVLDTDTFAPQVVRLLRGVTFMGVRTFKGWSWGPLVNAPFLPTVRYGRTVLSPARWRATPEDLSDDEALAAWRSRIGVPRHVRLAYADHRIGLDLESPVHRRLLRAAARSSAVDVCAEPLPDLDHGWLRGADGAYESELVLSLRSRTAARAAAFPGRPVVADVPSALPGGEWLYARIPCDTPRQHQFLTRHLLPWITAVADRIDRWFFLRYVDDRDAPELRIRLHGEPGVVRGEVLPALYELATEVAASGLAGAMTLAPYHPEVGRYGGTLLMPLAERVFAADSMFVLHRLQGADDPVLIARDLVALVRSFHGSSTIGDQWLLSRFADGYPERRLFAPHRVAALNAIGPDWPTPTDPIEREWADRLAAYGRHLAADRRDTALAALAHMHCNRRLGTEPDSEHLVYALASGALRAHQARAKSRR